MAEGFDQEIVIREVAAHGLLGDEAGHPVRRIPEDRWSEFRSRLGREKLTGLAVAAAESGWLELSGQQWEELLERQREDMLWVLGLERTLLELADALDRAEIEFVVLKGPALAHTVYPDPSWRPFVDIDLLVRTRDWRRTLALFADLGLKRRLPEPRPGFDERFGKGACHRTPNGKEIDLHRTLVVGPFGLWIRPEELLERRDTFVLGGRRIGRLDDTGMLLNVTMHASLGWRPPRLVPLRDVLQVSCFGDVEWHELSRWAREWRLSAVLQHAFTGAAETLGVEVPSDARTLVSNRAPRSEVRSLTAYAGDGRNRGGPALGTLRAISGMRSKVAYIRALLLPDREFLEARSGGAGGASYTRRWSVPVRWVRDRLGRRMAVARAARPSKGV